MEREYCIYKGERTLYPVAKINNYRSEERKKQANEIMDEEHVAFLLLESLYKSGKINKPPD
jgi:hypothetical protein